MLQHVSEQDSALWVGEHAHESLRAGLDESFVVGHVLIAVLVECPMKPLVPERVTPRAIVMHVGIDSDGLVLVVALSECVSAHFTVPEPVIRAGYRDQHLPH